MATKKLFCIMMVMSFLLITVFPLSAQFIFEQIEFETSAGYDLAPEDFEPASYEEAALFFLNISDDKLKAAAQEAGEDIEVQKMTIYIDDGNYALEMNTPDGKASMVSDAKTGKMYYIFWPKKKVIVFSAADMKETEQRAKKMAEEMMKNIPPEYREQYMAEMKGGGSKSAVKYKARPTGKKATKYGQSCEQYVVTPDNMDEDSEDQEIMVIWAAKGDADLAKMVEKTRKDFAKLFPSEEESNDFDEWEILPGKIPVEVRSYRPDFTGSAEITVSAITKIEKKSPPPDKFHVPSEKEGFEHGTMEDMMKMMMPGE